MKFCRQIKFSTFLGLERNIMINLLGGKVPQCWSKTIARFYPSYSLSWASKFTGELYEFFLYILLYQMLKSDSRPQRIHRDSRVLSYITIVSFTWWPIFIKALEFCPCQYFVMNRLGSTWEGRLSVLVFASIWYCSSDQLMPTRLLWAKYVWLGYRVSFSVLIIFHRQME